MKIFGSPCRIQIPSRPISCTEGWVQLIAKKEILIVVASLVHCCAIKKNVTVAWQLYDVADVQFTVKKEGPFKLLQQCCQPCGFPTNLGLFFCGLAGFFEDLRVACFGVFLIKIDLFLQIFVCGLLKFYSTLVVSIYCKTKFGRVFVYICTFGLVFSDLPPFFYI